MQRLALLISSALCGNALSGDTVEVAPGVHMPLMNLGGIFSEHSDFEFWLKSGGRGIDTAWAYGLAVQNSVGQSLRTSQVPGGEAFIATKVSCCMNVHGYGCAMLGGRSAPEFAQMTAYANLEQLGVDSVDLLLLHMPCDTLEDTVATYKVLEEFKASGKARAIGVSNFDASFLDAFLPKVSVKPAVNQCGFSIAHHSSPHGHNMETLRKCQEEGITYSAYSPLGGLSGGHVLAQPEVLAVAAAHKKSAAQVALRWVVQQGIPAITAGNNDAHLLGDMQVFDFQLSDDEMSRLTAVGAPSKVIFA